MFKRLTRVSQRRMDRCIRTIESYCEGDSATPFRGEELTRLCSDPKNLKALHALEAAHEIRMVAADGSSVPVLVYLEDKGVLHFYVRHEKAVSAVKGFIAGILSAFIADTLLPALFNTLWLP